MKNVVQMTIAAASVLLAALTLLPFIPSNTSWIRIWDFPRQQIAALLLAVLLAALWLLDLRSMGGQAVVALSVIALSGQAVRIWPYTRLHSVQAKLAQSCPDKSCVRLLVANVLFSNRNSSALMRHVRNLQPDLVLLLETGSWWVTELEKLRADFPYSVSYPEKDYGMYLMSRLALIDPEIRHLVDDRIPSIRTGVTLPSGATFTLFGLHPPPPPRNDTARRNAELLIVAREVKDQNEPAIVAGDLNDVAWSHSTCLFQRISGLLDPRVGRGFYSTFNANWRLLRWPLDHAFFDRSFRLLHLQVLDDIGSDHFPLFISLCHQPDVEASQGTPHAAQQDREDARKAIDEGLERAKGKGK